MRTILALLSLVFATGAQAQSAAEKYELSERCGKRAAEVFEKEWDDEVSKIDVIVHHQNHYNSHLNKCFYLVTVEGGKSKWINLWDLHENSLLASYVTRDAFVGCLVQEKQCKSEEEWRALIKPFMED